MLQAAGGGNEVDDIIRDLKKVDGFYSYVILNNDGKLELFLIFVYSADICGWG